MKPGNTFKYENRLAKSVVAKGGMSAKEALSAAQAAVDQMRDPTIAEIDANLQEIYGLAEHPSVAGGRVPLTLALLSPAHRPIQTTQDLPGFWKGSWKDVRSEMRGRYPKHVWPEDPAAAAPTTRAKPRGT